MFQKAKSVSLLVCKWGSPSPQPAACCLHLLRLRGSWLQKVRGPGTSLWPSSCVSDSPRTGAAPSPNSFCLKMGSLRGSSEAPPHTEAHQERLITLFSSPVIAASRATRRACLQTGPALCFPPCASSLLSSSPFFPQILWVPCRDSQGPFGRHWESFHALPGRTRSPRQEIGLPGLP